MPTHRRPLRELIKSTGRDLNASLGMTVGEIVVPVSSWFNDTANPPSNTSYGTASQSQFYVKAFDDTTTDETFYQLQLPGDYHSNLKLTLNWNINSTSTTTYIVWDASINSINGGEAVDAAGTGATAVAAAPAGTAYLMRETTIDLDLTGEALEPYDLVMVQLFRDHDHTSDTVAADANLLATTFTYDRLA